MGVPLLRCEASTWRAVAMYLGPMAKVVPTFHLLSLAFFTGVQFQTFHTPPRTCSRSTAAEREAKPSVESATAKRAASTKAGSRVSFILVLLPKARRGRSPQQRSRPRVAVALVPFAQLIHGRRIALLRGPDIQFQTFHTPPRTCSRSTAAEGETEPRRESAATRKAATIAVAHRVSEAEFMGCPCLIAGGTRPCEHGTKRGRTCLAGGTDSLRQTLRRFQERRKQGTELHEWRMGRQLTSAQSY